jgi:hypothetical protein
MTFTLVSHLREQLTEVLKERAEKIKREEQEKEGKALEVGYYMLSSFPRLTLGHSLHTTAI